MISTGKRITSATEPLTRIEVEAWHYAITHPSPDDEAHIRQLRIVRDTDGKMYVQLKQQLPYAVCGMFNPPYRRTENFAYTEHFIVDIDHLAEKGLNIDDVKRQLMADNRVAMMFTSPSEDGLKVLFNLKERCYDAGIYPIFYKLFVKEFSTRYHLEQVVDSRTCDVCRACFYSVDRDAYFNSGAVPVDMSLFLDYMNTQEIFDIRNAQKAEEKTAASSAPAEEERVKEPDGDALNRIREILGQRKKREKAKPFVPMALDEVMPRLTEYIADAGAELYDWRDIQYGKKLCVRCDNKLAEINLFYGKRGFSVVQTPKSGTSPELNGLMAELIESFIDTLY